MVLRSLKEATHSPSRALEIPKMREKLGFDHGGTSLRVLIGEYDRVYGELYEESENPDAVLLCIGWSGMNGYLFRHDPEAAERRYRKHGAIWYRSNTTCPDSSLVQHGVDFVLIPLEKIADGDGLVAACNFKKNTIAYRQIQQEEERQRREAKRAAEAAAKAEAERVERERKLAAQKRRRVAEAMREAGPVSAWM